MRHRRSSIPLLAATLMVGLITSCGVKANDNLASRAPTVSVPDLPSVPTGPQRTTTTEGGGIGGSTGTIPKRSTTTRPGQSTTTSSDFGGGSAGDPTSPGFSRDFLIKIYKDSGLSEAQATCLTDGIIDAGLIDPKNPSGAANVDPSAIGNLLVKCNISMSDFGGSSDQPGG